jgi:hypothetical protein
MTSPLSSSAITGGISSGSLRQLEPGRTAESARSSGIWETPHTGAAAPPHQK